MARKKPINSRQKGARGERELSSLLNEKYGYKTRRGQQYCGANGDPDVVGISGLHIECKRVEKLNIEKALTQAIDDARSGEIPAVFHRKDKDYWKVTVTLEDFMELWSVYEREVLGNESV